MTPPGIATDLAAIRFGFIAALSVVALLLAGRYGAAVIEWIGL